MDYDYIQRLQKNLDDYYQVKFGAIFNTKDDGDLRELIGTIKAIKKFSDLIKETNEPVKKEENNG